MGERGPPAKAPTTVSTTLRLDAGVRDKVEAAASKRRKSLANEIGTRLEQSFVDEFAMVNQFGDRQLQAVARMVFAAAKATVNVNRDSRTGTGNRGNKSSWLHDPAAFDAAVAAISKVFALIRPGGACASDQPAGVTYRHAAAAAQPGGVSYQPTFNAEELLREIAMAPLVAPARASRHALATVALRKDLGDAVLDRAVGARARAESLWAKEYGTLRRKQAKAPDSMTNEELQRMKALLAKRERLLHYS